MTVKKSKPREYIYDLVKSLTPEERRFFKMQASVQSPANGKAKKTYMQLFDLVDSMSKYDRDTFDRLLKQEGLQKYIQEKIAYLSKVIIRSLRYQHEHQNIHSRLRTLISTADLLVNKGFHVRAEQTLKNAQQLACEYEVYDTMLEVLDRRIDLVVFNKVNMVEELSMLDSMVEQTNELLDSKLTYRSLQHTIFVKLKEEKDAESKAELIHTWLKNPLLEQAEQAKGFYAQRSRLFILLNLYYVSHDIAGSYQAIQDTIDLWHTHAHLIQEKKIKYYIDAFNYLQLSISNRRFEACHQMWKDLEKYPPETAEEEAKNLHFQYRSRLLYQFNAPDGKKFGKLSTHIAQLAHDRRGTMDWNNWLTLNMNLTYLYLAEENYTDLFSLLDDLQPPRGIRTSESLKVFVGAFKLIVIFLESDDSHTMLERMTKAQSRKWRRNKGMSTVKHIIIRLFQKIYSSYADESLDKYFAQADESLRKEIARVGVNAYPGLNEFRMWTTAMHKGIPYAEQIKAEM